MKKIITIAIFSVIALLYFTKDISTTIADSPTPGMYDITGENISDGSLGQIRCKTYFYANAIGKNLQPMTKIVCSKGGDK